jgi:hypothetical protein
VPPVFSFKRFGDLLTDARDIGEIKVPIRLTRRPDTDEGDVCFADGQVHVGSRSQSTFRNRACATISLMSPSIMGDWPLFMMSTFVAIGSTPNNVVAVLSEASGRYCADEA